MYPLLSLIRAQCNFTCGVIALDFFKFLVVIAKNAVIKIGDKKHVVWCSFKSYDSSKVRQKSVQWIRVDKKSLSCVSLGGKVQVTSER